MRYVGLGAVEALESSPRGIVIAAFSKATYVRYARGLVVLSDPSVPPGPLHLSWPIASIEVGTAFAVPGAWRQTHVVWRGALPTADTMGPDVVNLLASVGRGSALLRQPWLRTWRAATAEPHGLGRACVALGGLGPGLTPSGDDALAGMLLAARLRRPGDEDDLIDMARSVDTHEISRTFLHWAAKGQSIEAVHRLLGGDATAVADLRAFGHTSGADLALGLAYGLGVRAPWRDMNGSALRLGR